MGKGLGVVAGIAAWVGWLTICPALGFPTLGLAAMLNRVLVPREEPGFWLGWALLLIGLVTAALVCFVAVERTAMRARIALGIAYGAMCWLLAGAVLMPLLGLADPINVAPPPAPPDPMHGSFMMLHLGVGAPLAALIAWLMLGAVAGATAGWRPEIRARSWAILYGFAAAVALIVLAATILPNPRPATSGGAGQLLASGPVSALPEGNVFISVIQLPQAPGAALGPHAHVPGFAYSLSGVATMTFADAPTMRLAPGEAGFMGIQQSHAHLNNDDTLPAATLAILIVAGAAVVAVLRMRSGRYDRRLVPAAIAFVIAVGGLGAWNPWSNDWLFLSVRPVAARGGPMPLPTASRTYESPDLAPLPPGPYVETLHEFSVAPGAGVSVESAGASVLLVVGGQARVQPAAGPSFSIGFRQAALVQLGSSVQLTVVGDRPARLLNFTIAPSG